jgi:hypothetical protein
MEIHQQEIVNQCREFMSGWWFGTFFIFPNSWDDDPI